MNDNLPNIEVIKAKKTGLFTNYIFKAIPLAFDESMSYYETLCGLLNYLKNTVIPTVNNNADAVIELQTLYEELKTYVDNYFENLDVQEEINNKLDKMVEDGVFDEIINQKLFGELNEKITNIENNIPFYKELNLTQNLFLSNDELIKYQSLCIDNNNNVYIYSPNNEPIGKLYKYNLINHNMVSQINNLKLYHGNSMCFINNKIYVAPLKDENKNYTNKKIIVYNLNDGIISELNPFEMINYANVSMICSLDENNLLIGLNEIAGNSDVSLVHFIKLNINTLNYEEIYAQYYTEINARAVDMTFKDNKLYLITGSPNFIIEYNYINGLLIQNKNYKISKKDDLLLPLCETESISLLPSNLYGDNTFIISSFMINNVVSPSSLYRVYYINFKSDLFNQYRDENDTNIMIDTNKLIHVSKNASNIQNGTNEYPFYDLSTAIEYANSNNINYNYISIDTDGVYNIGSLSHKTVKIQSNSNITLKIQSLLNCNVLIVGDNITIVKNSESSPNFNINNSSLTLTNCTLTSFIYASNNSIINLNNVNVISNDTYSTVFDLHLSKIYGLFKTINTPNATRFISLYQASYGLVNKNISQQTNAVLSGSKLDISNTN